MFSRTSVFSLGKLEKSDRQVSSRTTPMSPLKTSSSRGASASIEGRKCTALQKYYASRASSEPGPTWEFHGSSATWRTMLIRSWPLRPRMPVISMASSPCPLQRLRASLGDAAVPPVAYMSLYYIDEADNHERENTFSQAE